MADKIGVLGSATTATATTTTAYTVPAAKAAKVRLMWKALSHATNSTGDLTITVNGMVIAQVDNITAARYHHSNSVVLVSPAIAAEPTGESALLTASPAPAEYYLSAADTVSYTIATDAFQAMNFQVVGTEIDV